jgi:hypothetical protein
MIINVEQHSKNALNAFPGTFLVSRLVLLLRDPRVRQCLFKASPSRIYAVRLIVKMTALCPGYKVLWSNKGERASINSIGVRANFKYVEIIVRTWRTKREMPNPEIEIANYLHPKARCIFLPAEDACEGSRCVLPKPTRTVHHPSASRPSRFPDLILYSDQVLLRRLLQILRFKTFYACKR